MSSCQVDVMMPLEVLMISSFCCNWQQHHSSKTKKQGLLLIWRTVVLSRDTLDKRFPITKFKLLFRFWVSSARHLLTRASWLSRINVGFRRCKEYLVKVVVFILCVPSFLTSHHSPEVQHLRLTVSSGIFTSWYTTAKIVVPLCDLRNLSSSAGWRHLASLVGLCSVCCTL